MSDALELYVRCDAPVPVSDLQWREWLTRWLQALNVSEPCEISLMFTDDEAIQSLNRQYRQIDRSTDVLAFAARESLIPDLLGTPDLPQGVSDVTGFLPFVMLGDIVVSVATAERQAIAQQHSLTEELAWLVAHGLLHLLGWDHPDERSLQQMIRQQRELIESVQLCQVV
ncbi:MAG: rRNA maturation RNase YbeY [Cyanobacteria bacterium J06639_1]